MDVDAVVVTVVGCCTLYTGLIVVVPFEITLLEVSSVVNVTVSVTLEVLPASDAGVTVEDASDAGVDTVEGT